MQTVSIWVMKESVMLVFGVLKNCSLAAKHSGNSMVRTFKYIPQDFILFPKYSVRDWALVIHAYNPSYSGGRHQSGGSWFEASLGK
jgi:hypothetical protein